MRKKSVLFLFVVSLLAIATSAHAVGRIQLQVAKFALEKGVFNAVFAKELCSCQFVDGLTLDECKARDNLPSIAHSLVNLQVDKDTQTVSSSYRGLGEIGLVLETIGLGGSALGGSASAHVDPAHPDFGCVLTKLPSDP